MPESRPAGSARLDCAAIARSVKNQNGNTTQAGSRKVRGMMKMKVSTLIRARWKKTRKAPMVAEMAPEAPISGTFMSG